MHYLVLGVEFSSFVFPAVFAIVRRLTRTFYVLYSKYNCISPLALNIASHHSHKTKSRIIIIQIRSILQHSTRSLLHVARVSGLSSFLPISHSACAVLVQSACVFVSACRFFVHLALGYSLNLSPSVRLVVALLFFRGSHIPSSSSTSFRHAFSRCQSKPNSLLNTIETKRIAVGSIYFQVEYQIPWDSVFGRISHSILSSCSLKVGLQMCARFYDRIQSAFRFRTQKWFFFD